jgi:protein O-mannosyl-transferase
LADTNLARGQADSPVAQPSRLLATQYILLIVLSALPFLPSLRYQFAYDDDVQVVNNASIRAWDSVPEFFTSTSFGTFDPNAASNFHYRPIFYLWLRFNDALFGLNSFGWHLSSLCLHLAVTLLLFNLLRRHFKDSRIATAAALIFGVYPIHIESVVWVSGATDPLTALFLLASILLWLKRSESANSGLQIASLASYAAALLTKETAIVFPAIVFVYAIAGIKTNEDDARATAAQSTVRALREIIPFGIVTALYLIARYAVVHNVPPQQPWLATRDAVLSAPLALVFYLRHLIWPFRLSLFYSFSVVTSVRSILFWLPLATYAALKTLVWFWWRRTRAPAILAAAAWCLLPLLPVLDIALFQRDDTVHDRYLYLPSIGLAIGIGLVLEVLSRAHRNGRFPVPKTALISVLIAVLGISTLAQAAPWRDNFSLYQHAVEISPRNTIARNNFAGELTQRDHLDEAKSIFEAVLQDRPNYWLANYNLGYVNYRLKHFEVAEEYLLRAIELNPTDADQHAYLGLSYFHQNRFPDAALELRKAIAIKSAGTGYHIALALTLLQLEDLDGARSECLEELAYHPDNAAARAQLALIEQRIANPK